MRADSWRLSTGTYLFGLVAAVLIPLLLFTAFALIRYAATERARYEREAAQIARQIGVVVDAELAELLALLKGLAASSTLASDDFASLHADATRLVAGGDETIVLREPGPRQLLNTQRPFGDALPPAPPIAPDILGQLAAGRSIVDGVYSSPVSGEPRIAVALPVMREGRLAYVLAVTAPTTRIRDAIVPATPEGWIIGVGDRKGYYVARSEKHEEVSGKPAVADYVAKATGRSGAFVAGNFEGVMLLAGYVWSDVSGWLIAANIPQAAVEQPLRRSLSLFAVAGALALCLSALLAYLFGARFAAAAADLAERAAAVGQGAARPFSSPLREFAAIGDAFAAAASAVAERRGAEEALARRTRELETVLSTAPAGVWFTYDSDARSVARNRIASELMRIPHEEEASFGAESPRLAHITVLRDGRPLLPSELPLRRAARGERVENEEYVFAFDDGATRTLLTSASPVRDAAGVVIGAVAVSIDISERKRGEEQRRLLIQELNHRVKNTLATVQSVALQTLRASASLQDAQKALVDRLIALAKAHDVLTRESWEGADLTDIVSGAVAPHGGAERFAISGPPARLTPSLSLTLALALHELATNAAKYGALSVADGSVSISWTATEQSERRRLMLRWVERGGPPVAPPTRRGFGARLIERSLSAEIGGAAKIQFAPEGVTCILEASIGPALGGPKVSSIAVSADN